jgi:hypothetical protein
MYTLSSFFFLFLIFSQFVGGSPVTHQPGKPRKRKRFIPHQIKKLMMMPHCWRVSLYYICTNNIRFIFPPPTTTTARICILGYTINIDGTLGLSISRTRGHTHYPIPTTRPCRREAVRGENELVSIFYFHSRIRNGENNKNWN